MSIAALAKLTLVGAIERKSEALEALQALGCMHLIALAPPPSEVERAAPRGADDALKALKFLNGVRRQRRQVTSDPSFEVDAFVKGALELKQQLRDVGDRRDFLASRIAEVRPWGDLVFPPKAHLAGQHLWFYRLPVKHRSALQNPDLPPWSVVTTEGGHDYVVLISPNEPSPALMPVHRTHVGSLPMHQLEQQLEDVEIEIEQLAAERVAMTRYATLLRNRLSDAFTQAELVYAHEQTRDDEKTFAIQGWVPVEGLDDVLALADRLVLAALLEEPQWDETPPTLLERPPEETAGVDLAMFYQTPHYRSWDPSVVVMASFAIFFAMIVADAGYGALILLGLAMFWRRIGASARARSWRRLGAITALTTIGYGVLIGSFFGAPAPGGSLLADLKVLDLRDFDAMMRLSIVVGVIHIVIANLMSAWTKRRRISALSHIGWIAMLTGGLTYWLSGDDGEWTSLGMTGVVGGLVAIALFTSDRPIKVWMDAVWRLLDGLNGLTSLMGAFGDVLSYMRLFALGLASASLALTFNELASAVAEALPGLGVLAALLILLVGHALNFALGLLSGVVHGLRLNYIEFYKWGLPDEGVAFRAFARQEVTE